MVSSKVVFPILLSLTITNQDNSYAYGSTVSTGKNHSDLNLALKFCIGEMISSNFFSDTWTKYFPKVLPIAIPNNCNEGKIVPASDVDDSLRNILNTGKVRVGLSTAITNSEYLLLNASNASTATTRSGSNDTVDPSYTIKSLDGESIDGYEPACVREAVKRLGESYQMDIEPEFFLISGDNFFSNLQTSVDNNDVDFVWSVVTVTENRSNYVDYACNTHMGEYVIGAGPGLGSALPDPSGPQIPLSCYAVSCTFTNIPKPFYLKPNTGNVGGISSESLITNKTGGRFDYVLDSYENLWNFIRTSCPTCSQVDTTETIAADYRAPFTKLYTQTSNNQTASSSTRLMTVSMTIFSLITCFVHHIIIQTLL